MESAFALGASQPQIDNFYGYQFKPGSWIPQSFKLRHSFCNFSQTKVC